MVSRVTHILMTGILSLLFSVQAVGLTVEDSSMSMGDTHCATEISASMNCAHPASHGDMNSNCQAEDSSCQSEDDCSASHCSVGSMFVAEGGPVLKGWFNGPDVFSYVANLPHSLISTPYRPPQSLTLLSGGLMAVSGVPGSLSLLRILL